MKHVYLGPVSLLRTEGFMHQISDGEAGHGALSQRDDLVDGRHQVLQLAVALQTELAADLNTKKDDNDTRGRCTKVKTCKMRNFMRARDTWLEY